VTEASIFTDFWNKVVEHDEQGLFLVFAKAKERAKPE
jgi:hypothetical protein